MQNISKEVSKAQDKIQGVLSKETRADIQVLREDVTTLKNDAVKTARDLQEDGLRHADRATQVAREQINTFSDVARRELASMEKQVLAKPAQSILVAFAAGAVISFLFGRK